MGEFYPEIRLKGNINSFIHSFIQALLTVNYVPSIMLGTGASGLIAKEPQHHAGNWELNNEYATVTALKEYRIYWRTKEIITQCVNRYSKSKRREMMGLYRSLV